MKILTDEQLKVLIENAKSESYKIGYNDGKKEGYNAGLHEGLTKDKEGVHITNKGIYTFKNGVHEKAIIDKDSWWKDDNNKDHNPFMPINS